MNLKSGVIKKLCTDRQFGFISPEGGGLDVFFHVSCYTGDVPFPSLKPGDRVLYKDEVREYRNERRVKATFVQYTSTRQNDDKASA